MPITLATPPQSITDLTQSRIESFAKAGQFRIAPLARAQEQKSAIQLSSAHPVYNLGLKDITSAHPFDSLSLSAWRFIVQTPGGEPAAAETLSKGPSGSAEFSSVNSGPFVAGTIAAFAELDRDPAFATGNWEMRLLRIPALHIFAAWAHETRTGEDRLKVVQPAPPYLDPSQTYTRDGFVAAIKGAAEQAIAADDGLKG